jgi:hypothetical protein
VSAPVLDDSAPFDLAGPLPSGTVVLEASAGTGKTYTIAGLATSCRSQGGGTRRCHEMDTGTALRSTTLPRVPIAQPSGGFKP